MEAVQSSLQRAVVERARRAISASSSSPTPSAQAVQQLQLPSVHVVPMEFPGGLAARTREWAAARQREEQEQLASQAPREPQRQLRRSHRRRRQKKEKNERRRRRRRWRSFCCGCLSELGGNAAFSTLPPKQRIIKSKQQKDQEGRRRFQWFPSVLLVVVVSVINTTTCEWCAGARGDGGRDGSQAGRRCSSIAPATRSRLCKEGSLATGEATGGYGQRRRGRRRRAKSDGIRRAAGQGAVDAGAEAAATAAAAAAATAAAAAARPLFFSSSHVRIDLQQRRSNNKKPPWRVQGGCGKRYCWGWRRGTGREVRRLLR